MPFSVFIDMTVTACITVWSPGPNNILLLSTVSKYGARKNLRFLLGIWTGSLTLMCLSGFFCRTLGNLIPGIQPVMQYVGAAYLLFLAWQTAKRKPAADSSSEKEPSYLMGIFLQLINVKIIIYGLTMFSSFILPYENRIPVLFLFALNLMILGALGNLIWVFAGNILKLFYEKQYKTINIVMAGLLVWCAMRVAGVL